MTFAIFLGQFPHSLDNLYATGRPPPTPSKTIPVSLFPPFHYFWVPRYTSFLVETGAFSYRSTHPIALSSIICQMLFARYLATYLATDDFSKTPRRSIMPQHPRHQYLQVGFPGRSFLSSRAWQIQWQREISPRGGLRASFFPHRVPGGVWAFLFGMIF